MTVSRAAEGQQTLEIESAQSCTIHMLKARNRINRAIARQSSPIVASVEQACHAGGRGFESRRSRLLERLQIGRLRCQNRHGSSLGGPIPWAKRLRQNACKLPISCGDLVSGGTNESRSRARHRGSSSGVAADRRTRPDHHCRPRASPSGTFSEPTAHTGRLGTWDCQSHVPTYSARAYGLSG